MGKESTSLFEYEAGRTSDILIGEKFMPLLKIKPSSSDL
jgi:hypothetical protein